MSKIIELKINNRVISGDGSLKYLISELKNFNYKKLGIIVDNNLIKNNRIVKNLVNNINKNFKIIFHKYKLNFEPNYEYLDEIISIFKKKNNSQIDCIIAIGGGSVMDTAKAMAVMITNHGSSIKFKGFPKKLKKPVPVIAIPSTTGTGSELVFNASVIDNKNKQKLGINDSNNYPILAILDPRVVSTAPINIVISSTCDALVHAFESFSSPQSNEITKLFILESLKKIFTSFPKVLNGNANIIDWQNLQWGAYFAMIGLSNTSSGPSGALSYYLGVNYKVSHGIAGAFFLQKILRFNQNNGYYNYSELYNCLPNIKKFKKTLPTKNKSNEVVKYLEKLFYDAKIPKKISYFGVQNNHIDNFLNFSKKAKAAMKNNPKFISTSNLRKLLVSN